MTNCQRGDTAIVVRTKHPQAEIFIDASFLGRPVTVVDVAYVHPLYGVMWVLETPVKTTATERSRMRDGRIFEVGDEYETTGLPDWCLQPIRPNKKPEAIPAPSTELTHQ